jgi:hypothetical protein
MFFGTQGWTLAAVLIHAYLPESSDPRAWKLRPHQMSPLQYPVYHAETYFR